jgi:hypothetical protein
MEVDPLYCRRGASDPLYCSQLLPHSSTQVELLLSSPGEEEEEEEPCCSTPGLLAGTSSNSSQSSSGYSTAPSDTYCYADQINLTAQQQQQQQQVAHAQLTHGGQQQHRLVFHQGQPQHRQNHHHPMGTGLVLRPAAYAPLPPSQHRHQEGAVDASLGGGGGGFVFSISQDCEMRGGLSGGGSTRRSRGGADRSRKSIAAAMMGSGGGGGGSVRTSGVLSPLEHQLIRLDENHVI